MVNEADGLPVPSKRLRRARAAMQRFVPEFDEDGVLAIASEIGLFECVRFSGDSEGFEFEMTDLQTIAFAEALIAVADFRGLV